MSKASRDIPREQREFFDHFEKVAYRHSYSEVFSDYLVMMINFWTNGKEETWRNDALKKYSDKEKQEMNQMFFAHIRLQEEMIIKRERKWYDALGDIYQTISSNWKASGMGQFFTPETVVDFMAQIIISDDCVPYSAIAEPAAGSGRFILAAHSMQPLNYYNATDLDNTCAMMTAINMCFHGAVGIVNHANTLTLEWHKAYMINRIQISEKEFLPVITVTHDQKEANEHWWGISEYCRIMKGVPRSTVISQDKIAEAVDKFEVVAVAKQGEIEVITSAGEIQIEQSTCLEPEEQRTLNQAVEVIKKRSKKYDPDQMTLF